MRRAIMLITAVLLFSLVVPKASAEIPLQMKYQGLLTQSDGNPVPDGEHPVTFSIYNSDVRGLPLWFESRLVTTVNGIFSVTLGESEPIPASLISADLWLGITLEDEIELTPRQKLLSVPFAFRALNSDSTEHAESIANNSVDGSKIEPGSIELSDLASNGASEPGQVIKWNGSGWALGEDVANDGSSGWVTEADCVHLIDGTMSVGVGMTNPAAKLDVDGEVKISGRVTIGPEHSNLGDNTFVAGAGSNISGMASTVGGGEGHTISSDYATIAGGLQNRAGYAAATGGGRNNNSSGTYSVVAGGQNCFARGYSSAVGGGGGYLAEDSNSAIGNYSVVSGGRANVAASIASTVGGGYYNRARGDNSVIAGGGGSLPSDSNSTFNDWAVVSGGTRNSSGYCGVVAGGIGNTAKDAFCTVGGGRGNQAKDGNDATVAGGAFNIAASSGATICGGSQNNVTGAYSSIVGGGGNQGANSISGQYSTILGGRSNSVTGDYSLAAGRKANVLHSGSFLWTDSVDAEYYSNRSNEFAVRATGGFRVKSANSSYGGNIDNAGGSGDGLRVYADVSSGDVWAALYAIQYGTSPAIYARNASTGKAAYFDGDVHVEGTVTQTSAAYAVDHPQDPATKYLQHSVVGSSEMMNIYTGRVTLDAGGEAWVNLPSWFEALNQTFSYQLTPIGAAAPALYVSQEISGNRFQIAGGAPEQAICWLVTGTRADAYAISSPITVESVKPASEQGKYLHPELFNQPAEAGIGNHSAKEIE